jgi:hypothetical protein
MDESIKNTDSGEVVASSTDQNPDNKNKESLENGQKTSSSGASVIQFNDLLNIKFSEPLPNLDSLPAKAYRVEGQGKYTKSYFALICEKNLPPRAHASIKYRNIANSGLVNMVEAQVIYWPPEKQQKFVIIYEDSIDQPLVSDQTKKAYGWKQEQVMSLVIPSVVSALHDCRNQDFVHGGIRLNNLFMGKGEMKGRVVIGDCLALPPSYGQSTEYLTIERAMTQKNGRGIGTAADDLYAFGVCIAMLMRNSNPLKEMKEHEIATQKIEQGSYAALTGRDRFTGGILELLRGLLYDDPAQRWTIDEVMSWLDGQRLSPKQAVKRLTASRPLVLGNHKFYRPELIALNLPLDTAKSSKLIESGILSQWVLRSLEDEIMGEKVEIAIQTAQESGRSGEFIDRAICRVCIALDPQSPIRYKGLSMHPEGIGNALTDAVIQHKNLQPFIDIFEQGILLYWLNTQENTKVDILKYTQMAENCKNFVKRSDKVGFGIERCVYYLNEEAPCLSPRFKNYYIMTTSDLLESIKDMIGKPNPPAPDGLFDTHILAFLSVRENKVIDNSLVDIGSPEAYRRVFGVLKTLANIQRFETLPEQKEIALWISKALHSIYTRFHDRELREKLKKTMEKHVENGDLFKMIGLVDNLTLQKQDALEYRRATNEYQNLKYKISLLEQSLERPKLIGRKTGHEVAAIVSSLLGFIIILTFLYMNLNHIQLFQN